MSAPTTERTTLGQVIAERLALSDEPDPHVIAAGIAEDLPDDQLRAVAREGLVCIVRSVIRRGRSRSTAAEAPTSAKWDSVAAAVAANPDVFQRRYKTETGWKFLGDFTKKDAEWNHDQHVKLAEASTLRAAQFKALASRLKGQMRVRDSLTAEVVQEIFDA